MSQPGEHTSLAPHKGETQVAEKTSRKQHSQNHGDHRVEAQCDHGCVTSSRTCGTHDGRCRVGDSPVMMSGYGSVDTVSVCQSCQHLYAGNVEVVLSPASLEDHLSHHDPANTKPVSVHRPWAARKYEGLCDCRDSVSSGVCACAERNTHRTLHSLFSCKAPCLQKLKVAALVLAAILPWVFLVTYIVLTSI